MAEKICAPNKSRENMLKKFCPLVPKVHLYREDLYEKMEELNQEIINQEKKRGRKRKITAKTQEVGTKKPRIAQRTFNKMKYQNGDNGTYNEGASKCKFCGQQFKSAVKFRNHQSICPDLQDFYRKSSVFVQRVDDIPDLRKKFMSALKNVQLRNAPAGKLELSLHVEVVQASSAFKNTDLNDSDTDNLRKLLKQALKHTADEQVQTDLPEDSDIVPGAGKNNLFELHNLGKQLEVYTVPVNVKFNTKYSIRYCYENPTPAEEEPLLWEKLLMDLPKCDVVKPGTMPNLDDMTIENTPPDGDGSPVRPVLTPHVPTQGSSVDDKESLSFIPSEQEVVKNNDKEEEETVRLPEVTTSDVAQLEVTPTEVTSEVTPSDDTSLDNIPTDVAPAEVTSTEAAESAVTSPNVTESDVTSPNVTESDLTSLNLTESDVTSANVTESEDTTSQVTPAEVTSTEVTAPEVTLPKLAPSPNVTESDVTSPNVTESDLTSLNLTESDVTSANVTESEDTTSQVTPDEVTSTEVTAPEITLPKLTSSEVTPHEITNAEVISHNGHSDGDSSQ